jgi:hypothetical protein
MKQLKIIAVALLVPALATTVQAGNSKFSLLRCGLTWAGSTTQAKSYVPAKKKQKYDTQRALAFLPSHHPVDKTFTTKASDNFEQGLLPHKYAIARVGCSWR